MQGVALPFVTALEVSVTRPSRLLLLTNPMFDRFPYRTAFESPFRRYGGIGTLAHPTSVGRTRVDVRPPQSPPCLPGFNVEFCAHGFCCQGSSKPHESPSILDSDPHPPIKEEPGVNSFCYNSPPQSAILMSPLSALLPKDTPNVKFRMELASQIQDSPSSLAHLDANLMLNIGDTPNDKIRYAYRFGDDFGCGISPPHIC